MKKAFFLSCALFLVMGSIAELPLSAQTVTLTGSVRTVGGDPLAARISILRGPPAAPRHSLTFPGRGGHLSSYT